MKILRETSRILLGLTFLYSGFVKGIDPLGSTYKFTDYFNAFGTEWAIPVSFTLAFLLAIAEFSIGVAYVINYRVRLFSWVTLLFMGVFLPLTLWIAIKDPVHDCGCFGDALVISNWTTFYKNIALTAFAVIVFIFRKQFNNKFSGYLPNGLFTISLFAFVCVQYYSYNHLPIIDFRPYKIGVNISEAMQTPPGAPSDKYRTEFTYRNKNTGEQKQFSDENYPWRDTLNWEYVDSKSILLKKGYQPPINNFIMTNSSGVDVADYYLQDDNYTFILVSYNLSEAKTVKQETINQMAQKILSQGMNFVCLTGSGDEEINLFRAKNNPPYEFLFCDEIPLKTIVRANPGLVLLKKGTIINKWHWKDIKEDILKSDFFVSP